jgi:hypothetical protein
MNRKLIRICNRLLIAAALVAPSIGPAYASAAPRLSGSYRILEKTDRGGETRTKLQLRLVNPTARDLYIQRVTLWDFSHPSKRGTRPCTLVIHAASSVSTVQEFTIPQAELDLWKRGTRPRVVLELATPNGHPSSAVVRLDRASGKGY